MNVPRSVIGITLFLCLLPCVAQTPPGSGSSTSSPLDGGSATSLPPAGKAAPTGEVAPVGKVDLFVSPSERRFFALGLSLSQAGFAHARLTQQAARLSHFRTVQAKVDGLAALTASANAARQQAQEALARTADLLPLLNAPARVSIPILHLSTQLTKPLALTGDAAAIAPLSTDAAHTLASLGEARQLSDLLNLPALRAWLKSPDAGEQGPVWYAEGVLAGVAEAADTQSLPGLLPPAADLATDLRGLRDWLSGRLPDTPTPEQDALQDALSGFLQGTTGRTHPSVLSTAQLHALGDISRMLQAQMLCTPNEEKGPPSRAALLSP